MAAIIILYSILIDLSAQIYARIGYITLLFSLTYWIHLLIWDFDGENGNLSSSSTYTGEPENQVGQAI